MEHWINCFEDHSQEDLDKIKENVVWQNAWMEMLEGNLALSATAMFQGSTKWASHLKTRAGQRREPWKSLFALVCQNQNLYLIWWQDANAA